MSFAGWIEILFISLIAFVIIGPKDLPKVLVTLGRFVQTLRNLFDELTREFETIRYLKELEEKRADHDEVNKKN